jgi:predicted flap endonuclease-1-like 5' DNA nuclease
MSTTTIIVIAVIVVIALAFLFLVRGRKQHVTFSDTPPLTPKVPQPRAEPARKPIEAAKPAPVTPSVEGHGLTTEIADAVEDVVDQFVGINSHTRVEPVKGPGDTLTQLKGLGPKAASILADLGVTRFEQIASWNDADVAAIDAQMGAFKGRITRDRWVDQARLLARGDTAAFEAEFGALGS